MAIWRVVLLVLPQAGVAYAYGAFHAAATAAPAAAFESSHLGILVDSMVLIAVGWLTVAANLIVAVVLLRYVAKRDVRAYCRGNSASGGHGSTRPAADGSSMAPRQSPTPALRVCPPVIATTPFD